MLLEPGPLSPLSEVQPTADIEPGGFGDLARSEMLQGASWEDTLDGLMEAPATLMLETPGDRLKDYVDPALAFANDAAGQDPTAEFTAINSDTLTVDGALIAGYGNVPAEAWQPLPDNLREEIYDTIPPQPGQITGQLGLPTNMSSQAFTAGGPFRLIIQVTPRAGSNEQFANLDVELDVYLRPNSPYQIKPGQTNAAGVLQYDGTWPADAEGQWVINTIVYGSIGVNGPSFTFSVGAASAGGSGGGGGQTSPVSVSITNLNTQSHTAFRVGDDFTLTVTGAPNAQITITIFYQDGHIGSAILGTTNSTGRFDYTGRFSASDVGTYTENYTVGGVLWPNSLHFTVSA